MKSSMFLRAKEICPIYGIELSTAYRMLHRGDVPGAFQIGRSWFINKQILFKELEKLGTFTKRPTAVSLNPDSDRHGIST